MIFESIGLQCNLLIEEETGTPKVTLNEKYNYPKVKRSTSQIFYDNNPIGKRINLIIVSCREIVIWCDLRLFGQTRSLFAERTGTPIKKRIYVFSS